MCESRKKVEAEASQCRFRFSREKAIEYYAGRSLSSPSGRTSAIAPTVGIDECRVYFLLSSVIDSTGFIPFPVDPVHDVFIPPPCPPNLPPRRTR